MAQIDMVALFSVLGRKTWSFTSEYVKLWGFHQRPREVAFCSYLVAVLS